MFLFEWISPLPWLIFWTAVYTMGDSQLLSSHGCRMQLVASYTMGDWRLNSGHRCRMRPFFPKLWGTLDSLAAMGVGCGWLHPTLWGTFDSFASCAVLWRSTHLGLGVWMSRSLLHWGIWWCPTMPGAFIHLTYEGVRHMGTLLRPTYEGT